MTIESQSIRTEATAEPTAQVPVDMPCAIRIVKTNGEFDALEGAWNALLDQTNSTIFQTFEWIRTWWKYNATSNDELHILLFTSGDQIVGIAPLYTERIRFMGVRLVSRLQCVAHGLSDYVDFIILPGFEQAVLNTFALHLRDNAADWDILDIEVANEHSPLVQMLPAIIEKLGMRVYQYQGSVCPRAELPASAEMLMESIKTSTRSNYKRKIKKLQSGFKTEVITYKNETDNIAEAVETFAYIHGQRWKNLGYPSAFDDDALRAHHIEISEKFARRGWLRLFLLKVNDLPVAVSYDFNYNGCIYMYHNNAHGPDEVMKYSPGFFIRSVAMTEGINEGMRVFDYLRGNEPYKYNEWPVTDTKNYLIRASSLALTNRLRFTLFLVEELMKKSVDRIKRERYDYRKFTITKHPSFLQKCLYAGSKITDLFILGFNFLVRHGPFRSIQQLQIQRDPSHAGHGENKEEKYHNAAEGFSSWRHKLIRRLSLKALSARIRRKLFSPKVIAEAISPISGTIKVIDHGRERCLMINDLTLSMIFTRGGWGEVRKEYWGQIHQTPFLLPQHPRVLLCGLGGGTILHLLAQDLSPASVTVLELDQAIIDIGKQYFLLEKIPGLQIIAGDAKVTLKTLREEGKQFDLIIDDAFYDLSLAEAKDDRFITRSLTPLLAPGGSIALNRTINLKSDEPQIQRLVESLRNARYTVTTKSIRNRWWNDIIFCQPSLENKTL